MYVVDGDAAVWNELDGEAVVIHTASAQYYGVNPSGTRLWKQLVADAGEEQLAAALVDDFGRPPGSSATRWGRTASHSRMRASDGSSPPSGR